MPVEHTDHGGVWVRVVARFLCGEWRWCWCPPASVWWAVSRVRRTWCAALTL